MVVYREVLLLPSPLRTSPRPALGEGVAWRSERREGKVELRAQRWGDRLYKGRLCLFAIGFREERAERKARKGLQEVCLPSAGGETRGACGRRSVREERPEPEGRVGDLLRE